jgi:hypothetical protein
VTNDLALWVGHVEEGRVWCVQRKPEREVFAFPARGEEAYWIKRGWGSRRREIRREAQNARLLSEMDLGPAVVASGRSGDFEWLVTQHAGGWPLYRSGLVMRDPAERRRCSALLALGIRELHAARLAFPDLTASHLFFNGHAVWMIDPARLEHHARRPSLTRRARDLGALIFSLDWAAMTRADRVRLLRDASGTAGEELRSLLRLVEVRVSRLANLTRWRHDHRRVSPEFASELVDQVMTVMKEPRHFPARDIWRRDVMTVVRTLPDRENRTFGRGPDGRPLFFVKVFPPTKKGWSPAMREIAAIDLFQRAGILVNRVAAYAEDIDKGSMVAVDGCDGEPLDDFLRRGATLAERRALAVQTARIWRRMRECGLRHRDAYACHLFVAPWGTQRLRYELRLIDMTRAGAAPFPRERWFVKDAAALWHGCPKPPVTRTDAVRWLREYFRIPRLDARAKRFARRVAAKERRVAARQARKSARKSKR